ncbi:hypothetical protein LTR95_013515 [Oleoguttula sp. CCFEE 5521]
MAMTSKLPRYEYQTLDDSEIRVLEVLPGVPGSPIRAHVQHIARPVRTTIDWGEYANLETANRVRKYHTEKSLSIGCPCGGMIPYDSTGFLDEDSEQEINGDRLDALDSEAGIFYEAISYAWGSSNLVNHIIIDDTWTLAITLSLYQALQSFRLHYETRLLWADAVCIDQSNLIEKAVQVSRMGETYQSATRVLAWLGESDRHDRLAFGLLEWGHHRHTCSANISAPDFLSHKWASCTCCDSDPVEADKKLLMAIDALHSLTKRSWFQRLWVVQEVALGRLVLIHCGAHRTSLEAFEAGLSPTHPGFGSADISGAGMLHRIVGGSIGIRRIANTGQFSFPQVVSTTSTRACFNLLDRVYGVIGVTELGGDPQFFPDYTKTPAELFAEVTRHYLAKVDKRYPYPNPHAAVLLAIAATARDPLALARYEAWPSWVPDFNHLTTHHIVAMRDFSQNQTTTQFRLGPQACRVRPVVAGSNVSRITLGARVFGSIVSVASETAMIGYSGCWDPDSPTYNISQLGALASLQAWLERCANFLRAYSLRCVSSKDYHAFLRDSPFRWTHKDVHSLLHAMLAHGQRSEATERVRELLAKENGAYALIRAERCLAAVSVVDKIFIGWVPSASRTGDSLCIVYSCPFPLVIRAKAPDAVFEMLGDAYLDGLTTEDAVPEDSAVKIWYPDDTSRPSPEGQ